MPSLLSGVVWDSLAAQSLDNCGTKASGNGLDSSLSGLDFSRVGRFKDLLPMVPLDLSFLGNLSDEPLEVGEAAASATGFDDLDRSKESDETRRFTKYESEVRGLYAPCLPVDITSPGGDSTGRSRSVAVLGRFLGLFITSFRSFNSRLLELLPAETGFS